MSDFGKNDNSLAERIRLARVSAKITQQGFAEALGVHKNTVGKWERGEAEPDLKSVSILSKKLGISLYWLLNGEEPTQDKKKNLNGNGEDQGEISELRRKIDMLEAELSETKGDLLKARREVVDEQIKYLHDVEQKLAKSVADSVLKSLEKSGNLFQVEQLFDVVKECKNLDEFKLLLRNKKIIE